MNNKLINFIDRIPIVPLALIAVLLALAPFMSQPHLIEKITMLFGGKLTRPIDIFDLFLHGFALILLAIKVIRILRIKSAGK